MSVAERRLSPRFTCSAGGRLAHEASGREFPVRCIDASAGGVLLRVPLSAPLSPGQQVSVTLAGETPSELTATAASRRGLIVRVDRSTLFSDAHLQAAVAYDKPQHG